MFCLAVFIIRYTENSELAFACMHDGADCDLDGRVVADPDQRLSPVGFLLVGD